MSRQCVMTTASPEAASQRNTPDVPTSRPPEEQHQVETRVQRCSSQLRSEGSSPRGTQRVLGDARWARILRKADHSLFRRVFGQRCPAESAHEAKGTLQPGVLLPFPTLSRDSGWTAFAISLSSVWQEDTSMQGGGGGFEGPITC